MNAAHPGHRRLERLLSRVLRYGTWLACTVIASGLVWAFLDAHAAASGIAAAPAMQLVTLGVATLLVLPVLRVTLMAVAFALERDYMFVGIATLVLAIIGLGLALGGR